MPTVTYRYLVPEDDPAYNAAWTIGGMDPKKRAIEKMLREIREQQQREQRIEALMWQYGEDTVNGWIENQPWEWLVRVIEHDMEPELADEWMKVL